MGWKIIEIENCKSLNLFLNNLVIKKDNEQITISINDIDVLLINNYKLKITINLINELSKNNVLVIVCNKEYIPQTLLLPIIGNYNTLKVLNNQLNWTLNYKSSIWNQIIQQKIINQALFLKKINILDAYEKLMLLSEDIKLLDVTNREGHAAKIYWHNLFGIDFKRHENDYYNKLLNYGYTILRGYFCRSIVKKGLDPRISFFHNSYHNHFALASDLMEPFRIIIDNEVYKIYLESEINFYKHKEQLIKCFNQKIFINNKKYFINNAIDIFIDYIVNNENILPEVRINYEWL